MDAYDKEQGSYTPMGPSTADRIPRQQRLNALANPPVDKAWRNTSTRPKGAVFRGRIVDGKLVDYNSAPKELKYGAYDSNGKRLDVQKPIGGVGSPPPKVDAEVGSADVSANDGKEITSKPLARSASTVAEQPAQNSAAATDTSIVAQENNTAAPLRQNRHTYDAQQNLRTTAGSPFLQQSNTNRYQYQSNDTAPAPEEYEGSYGLFSIDPRLWSSDFLNDLDVFNYDQSFGLEMDY